MQFYSTNGQCQPASLKEAVMQGLAPDGGLFMPERIPVIPRAFFNNIGEMNIREISYVVADLLLGQDIESEEIQKIVNDTFSFDVPLARLDDNIYALELFHGPTLAFKDVGARFLARVISHYSGKEGRTVKVIVATSGDSGGAVANGFLNVPGVEVYVVYPSGCLTQLQRAQFTIPGSNIHPIEVIGNFDDCQRIVKECLADQELRRSTGLTSANSINICRLIPQLFYFFHAYASLVHRLGHLPGIVVSVPCGNLGNLTAGLLAREMGLPISRFVVANNVNDTTVRYLHTGIFDPRRAVRTVACAMDVGNPSNIQRIRCIFDTPGHSSLPEILHGYSYTDEDILGTISDTYSINSYLTDPHGAAALRALREDLKEGETGVFLETAHPSKFPRAIESATGVTFPAVDASSLAKVHIPRISSSADALKKTLASQTIGSGATL
ncbi:MAG: threonine synthase [Muribaculaceae bacterium]|nr:threonine synthase [Muribaculaceae bacterium]